MTTKTKVIIALVLLVAAFSAGRFSNPKNVEVKEVEKTVYRDRITQDDKHHVRTEIRETLLPDGTKITETITDNNKESHTDSQRESLTEKQKEMKITSNQSQWGVGVYTNTTFNKYSVTIDRRIFGGLFLGVNPRMELPGAKMDVLFGARVEF